MLCTRELLISVRPGDAARTRRPAYTELSPTSDHVYHNCSTGIFSILIIFFLRPPSLRTHIGCHRGNSSGPFHLVGMGLAPIRLGQRDPAGEQRSRETGWGQAPSLLKSYATAFCR